MTSVSKPRKTAEQWQTLIDQFDSENDTISEFCRRNQVGSSSFYKWRDKLSADVRAEDVSPKFIEITPATVSAPESKHWDIELQLADDMILRIRKPC